MLLTLPRQVRLLKCSIMSPGLELRAANDADRDRLRAGGYDISPHVQRIDIFESIFDNTLSGSVTVLENVGLVEYLPIVGVETLIIGFSVENEDGDEVKFVHGFRITKIGDIQYPRHDYRLYTISFATNEFVTSVATRICRAFKNKTATDCVKDILKADLQVDKLVTEEQSFDKIDVVIPNYTPLQAINYFAMLSQTKEGQEANFLFFETLEGYHFTSIRKLIKDGLAQKELRVLEVNPGKVTGANTVEDETVRNAVIRVHQDQAFDLLHDIAGGTLRSRVIFFDFLAQKVDHDTDSRYNDTFKKTTHLAKFPVYPDNFDLTVGKDVRIFTIPANVFSANSTYAKGKGEDSKQQRLREAIVLRNRQLKEIRHIQTIIDIPGQPDLRAGTVVDVRYPSTRILEGKDTSINVPVLAAGGTPYYSGPALVTAVHHILAAQGSDNMEYRMNIRVNRDSLNGPLIGTTSEKGK